MRWELPRPRALPLGACLTLKINPKNLFRPARHEIWPLAFFLGIAALLLMFIAARDLGGAIR